MRIFAKAVLLSAGLSSVAFAQGNPQGTITHVVVVIQENRTPDFLFGSKPTFETGVNLSPQSGITGNCLGTHTVPLKSVGLNGTADVGHTHEDFQDMCDLSASLCKMDGASLEFWVGGTTSCTGDGHGNYPLPFAYAQQTDVQPYFDIATQFGFANYMFQTNQGPSFPAHQFLFSGTSAPITDNSTNQALFASENPTAGQNSTSEQGSPTGCLGHVEPTYTYYNVVPQIDPSGTEGYTWWNPNLFTSNSAAGFPCYIHNSIADLLDNANPPVSWKYYTNDPTSLWTAPNALYGLCAPSYNSTTGSYTCTGRDWSNVIAESSGSNPPNAAQVLKDIFNCQLPNVSFVTPDGAWSDHAGQSSTLPVLGPSWVAAIVNAIGNGMTNSICNPPGQPYYWKNTVILITWDDWGGWYDHVSPPGVGSGYINGNLNGQPYVYGFRVPLLVVSAYSKTKGYVSGPAGFNQCPPAKHSTAMTSVAFSTLLSTFSGRVATI